MEPRRLAFLTSFLALTLAAAFALAAEPARDGPTARIGTYDGRAIAVAYASSSYNPVAQKMREQDEAKKAGDRDRVRALEEWGEKHQRQLHRQGFCRVPVDDLLVPVRQGVAKVAAARGLDAITSSCDWVAEGVETVDVTADLVQLYGPSEKTLKTIQELLGRAPLDLDDVEGMDGH